MYYIFQSFHLTSFMFTGKLIIDLNCKLIFLSKNFQIKDSRSSRMIGQADLIHGLILHK